MLTLEQAKGLIYGQILYHVVNRNSKGKRQKWRVSGKPKTWKRYPEKVRVPIKHGLYHHDAIDELNLFFLSLTEEETK